MTSRLLQAASAGVFTFLEPNLDYATAWYLCVITATTVGYGDVQITTEGARGFACIYITVSVSWLAAVVSLIGRLLEQRSADEKLYTLVTVSPTEAQVNSLDADGNGHVTEFEFVVGMIDALGIKFLGKHTLNEVFVAFRCEFAILDRNGDGFLNKDDLAFYKTRIEREASVRNSRRSADRSSRRSLADMTGTGNGQHEEAESAADPAAAEPATSPRKNPAATEPAAAVAGVGNGKVSL